MRLGVGFLCLMLLCGVQVGCFKKKKKPGIRRVVKRKIVKRARYRPPAPRLPLGVVLREKEVWVSGGSFFMGGDAEEGEAPGLLVTLSRMFAMWRHEVTQGEYQSLMGYNPSTFKGCGSNCPVETLSWHEAANFCNVLSRKHGLASCYECVREKKVVACKAAQQFEGKRYSHCAGYRLPTEAEWEMAARAGSSKAVYKPALSKWVDDTNFSRIAWYRKNSHVRYKGGFECPRSLEKESAWKRKRVKGKWCGTHPVEQKEPNLLGLYDMLGNVFEWTYDGHGPYAKRSVKDPVGVVFSKIRVYRGCAWISTVDYCKVNRRFWVADSMRSRLTGFRPVRSLWFAEGL